MFRGAGAIFAPKLCTPELASFNCYFDFINLLLFMSNRSSHVYFPSGLRLLHSNFAIKLAEIDKIKDKLEKI